MRADVENRISAPCWDGRHQRCTGWMVIPDHSDYGRAHSDDVSVRCECSTCDHPAVDPDRHHFEKAQPDATYEMRGRGGVH